MNEATTEPIKSILEVGQFDPAITTFDVDEKTNLYYTNTRARAAIIGGTGINYDQLTGIISTIDNDAIASITGTTNQINVNNIDGDIILSTPQNIATTSSPIFAGLTLGSLTGILKASAGVISGSATTSNLTEGTNLYYTNERARLAISAGTGLTYDNLTGIITNSITTTSNLTEGTNLYYTDERARLAISAGTGLTYDNLTGIITGLSSTSDLNEGTNLYYTDERARLAISAGTGINYDNITGIISSSISPVSYTHLTLPTSP
jgi:hypothetical protein